MINICKRCAVAKSIKEIRCEKCKKEESTYSNALDICVECAKEADTCRICGNSMSAKYPSRFDESMRKYEENIESNVDDIVDWVKREFSKTGAKGVVLGMSGGIDCSVVARLFDMADIPVTVAMMPYGNSMDLSDDRSHAKILIDKFKLNSMTVNITTSVDEIIKTMNSASYHMEGSSKVELSKEAIMNVKPRVRMTTLYALAQSMGYLVAGTGNLSERTMGYFTKWGDGASDINPIGNLTKTEVRLIAKAIGIPDEIISKPPSANLFEGQTDEDEMGVTYYDLDSFIITREVDADVKDKVLTAISATSHKTLPVPMYVPTEKGFRII